ncbi:hypothetical protein vseg_003137 [Gypsophila vaccaria]
MDSISKTYSVIIVGAGISGISAAKTLNDGGINEILILEATSRIGGRMNKIEFGGQVVELGANWLHAGEGPLCTSLLEAANNIQLNKVVSDYTHVASHVHKQEGGLYEENEVQEAMEAADKMQKYGAKLSETKQKFDQDDISILDMQRLYNWNPTSPLEKLVDYYYYDYEDGDSPEVTSLKQTLPRREFDDFGDGQYFIADPRGFETIVHHLAKQFLTYTTNDVISDTRIKLNQVIIEIGYTHNGVTVKTEDGFIYKAKACIVSVSLGVLQSNLIKFKPKLPEWKRRSICEFSIASFTKIFLKFPYTFWPIGPGTDFFLYASEKRGYYPIWKHYENEMPGSNILLVMTSGEESVRIEQQADEVTKTESMKVLRKMYGNTIPEAEDILVSKWKCNKFYKGAFSNWPPNYTQQQHAQLQAPIGQVYFTGEHTSPDHFGCVEGAYYAGCTTGREVIKYIRENY